MVRVRRATPFISKEGGLTCFGAYAVVSKQESAGVKMDLGRTELPTSRLSAA